jgi:hypothetical protein
MNRKLNVALVLFPLLGVATLVAGSTTFATVRDETWGLLASTLLFEASLIFFTALIIERLLLAEFEKRAVEAVHEIVAEAVGTFTRRAEQSVSGILNSAFAVLERARDSGLVDILYPRIHAKGDEVTVPRIQESLRNTKTVKVLCTSGREFFDLRRGPFADVFQQKARDTNAEYRLKILVGDPEGWAVHLRGTVEDPQNPDWVRDDILDARAAVGRLRDVIFRRAREGLSNWSVEAKYYNFFPPAWFVITDNEIFIEQYHLGDIRDLYTDDDPCIGQRVRVLAFSKESEMYKAFDRFHEWLWTLDSNWPQFQVTDIPELQPTQ